MSDGTAWINIDDATSYVYTDDSTGVTDVEAATAETLVSDFNSTANPLETRATFVQQLFGGIKDDMARISPTDYTPEVVMDAFTDQALNAGYVSSSWLQGKEGLREINKITTRCSILGNSKLPKYGDIARVIENTRKGIIKKASDAIDDVANDIAEKFGKPIQESAIGKVLSEIVNTGRSVFDKAFSGNQLGPVSDVLESAKAGIAKAQSTLSKIAGPLRDLDSLLECVNAVGGAAYAAQTDEMIDRTQTLFDKMYMHSDPALPNYGEFDSDAFMDTVTLPPLVKSNVLKSANLQNKVNNNAALVVDRAVDAAKPTVKKSTSSLSPNNDTLTNEAKRTYAQTNVEVTTVTEAVPPVKGREAEPSTETEAPEPQRVPTVLPPTQPQEQPPDKVPINSLVAETEFIDGDGSYALLDPGGVGIPSILAKAHNIIPESYSSTPEAQMKIEVETNVITTEKRTADGEAYNVIKIAAVSVAYSRIDDPSKPVIRENFFNGVGSSKKVSEADYLPLTDEQKRKIGTLVQNTLSLMANDSDTNLTRDNFELVFGLGVFEDIT